MKQWDSVIRLWDARRAGKLTKTDPLESPVIEDFLAMCDYGRLTMKRID